MKTFPYSAIYQLSDSLMFTGTYSLVIIILSLSLSFSLLDFSLIIKLGHASVRHIRDRQTDGQTNRQTDRWTDKQTDRQMDRQTDGQTNRQTDRWTDRQTDRQMDRQIDRQTDGQIDIIKWSWAFQFLEIKTKFRIAPD